MPSDLVEFSWPVHQGAYAWEKRQLASDREGYALVIREDTKPSDSLIATGVQLWQRGHRRLVRRYAPLRTEPALFRIFAETEPTLEGILAFANQHGHLGVETVYRYEPDETAPEWAQVEGINYVRRDPAEPFEAWEREILAMRNAIAVLDLVNAKNVVGLKKRLREESRRFTFDPEQRLEPLIWINPDPALVSPAKPDPLRLGLVYVQTVANRRIGASSSVKLLWPQDDLEAFTRGSAKRDPRPVVHIVPADLLGAMWLQLAQSIGADFTFARCDRCGVPFRLAPQARRKKTVYCSSACRSAAYRERQDRALKLNAEGKTLKAIAKMLGSDPETVWGWVEGKKSTDR